MSQEPVSLIVVMCEQYKLSLEILPLVLTVRELGQSDTTIAQTRNQLCCYAAKLQKNEDLG